MSLWYNLNSAASCVISDCWEMDCLFAGGSGVGESGWLHCTNWPGQSIQIGWRTVTDEKPQTTALENGFYQKRASPSIPSIWWFHSPCANCQFGAPNCGRSNMGHDQHHTMTGMCAMWALWYQETQSMSLPCADTDMHTRGNTDSTAVLEYVLIGRVNLKLRAMCRWASFLPLYPSALPQGIAFVQPSYAALSHQHGSSTKKGWRECRATAACEWLRLVGSPKSLMTIDEWLI